METLLSKSCYGNLYHLTGRNFYSSSRCRIVSLGIGNISWGSEGRGKGRMPFKHTINVFSVDKTNKKQFISILRIAGSFQRIDGLFLLTPFHFKASLADAMTCKQGSTSTRERVYQLCNILTHKNDKRTNKRAVHAITNLTCSQNISHFQISNPSNPLLIYMF